MKKYITFSILAVLLIAVLAFVGCNGQNGATGATGAAGANADYTVVQTMIDSAIADLPDGATSVGSTATVVLSDNEPGYNGGVVVWGSGFPDGKVVTFYFASQDNPKALKWFKVTANEVGGIYAEVDVPDELTLRDVLLDITPLESDDWYYLTVNAYAGSTLMTSVPIGLEPD